MFIYLVNNLKKKTIQMFKVRYLSIFAALLFQTDKALYFSLKTETTDIHYTHGVSHLRIKQQQTDASNK